jgi:hypothetical protein
MILTAQWYIATACTSSPTGAFDFWFWFLLLSLSFGFAFDLPAKRAHDKS